MLLAFGDADPVGRRALGIWRTSAFGAATESGGHGTRRLVLLTLMIVALAMERPNRRPGTRP